MTATRRGKEVDVLLTTIGLFATAILLGSMVFFSAVMAPLIFTKLDAEIAGPFIRQVFPWYYLAVIVLGTLAALSLFAIRLEDACVLAAVAATAVITRQLLMPCINRARDAVLAGDSSAGRGFSRLHKLSVWINAVQIIAVAIVLARLI